MKRSRLVVGAILLFVFAAFLGCAKDPASVGVQGDEDAIRELVEENVDYITAAGINDDGAQPVEYAIGEFAKVTELISPIRFGRKGKFKLERIDVQFPSDTLAIATIVHSFNGSFLILAKDTTDTVAYGKLYKKEMENTVIRRAIFKKVANTDNPRRNWRMRRISGSVARSPETTLAFEWVKVNDSNGNEWIIEEPLQFILDLEKIPVFTRRDTVKVFVKINNASPYALMPGETVMLRYRNDRGMHRARKSFNDEGIYPDEVAGDGIYSGMWVIRARRGIFHAFVDAIDNGTIYDDQLPYNSLIWGFPYLVK